jgi:hypothetical protein
MLAKGEYRILVTTPDESGDSPRSAGAGDARTRFEPRGLGLAATGIVLLAVGFSAGLGLEGLGSNGRDGASVEAEVAESALWSPLLDDGLPTLVVVGDYYIFGELDARGDVERLVRNFSINSSRDLDELLMYEPEVAARYLDLDLTYLPRGAAFALIDVLRVLYTSNKPVRVVSMSELNVAELKSNHVLYIGYISALDKLEDFVFASSSLSVGDTYDELRSKTTQEFYTSEAGIPASHKNYRDYGLISTFPGPGGNQFLIVAGTRDAGLMQAGHAVSDPMFVRSIEQARPEGDSSRTPAFEMLYEVTGFDRTNLDAMLVHTASLRYQEIWGGNLLSADY